METPGAIRGMFGVQMAPLEVPRVDSEHFSSLQHYNTSQLKHCKCTTLGHYILDNTKIVQFTRHCIDAPTGQRNEKEPLGQDTWLEWRRRVMLAVFVHIMHSKKHEQEDKEEVLKEKMKFNLKGHLWNTCLKVEAGHLLSCSLEKEQDTWLGTRLGTPLENCWMKKLRQKTRITNCVESLHWCLYKFTWRTN